MTYLLIDNSNTRTKFVLSSPEALLPERYMIPTREVSGERLDEVLAGVRYDAAVVCSGQIHFLSCDSRLGVGIDYPHPRQIGADRLANAVGAAAYYGYPCVVVDFGTAVTFDVIGPQCTYVGGVIAPGLASMGDYLERNTALLPAIDPQEPSRVIGTSTVEAMQSGAVYGYRGLVKEILARLEGELGVRPAVVATGGDAALIARGVERIDHVDPDITLNGLRIAAGLNL